MQTGDWEISMRFNSPRPWMTWQRALPKGFIPECTVGIKNGAQPFTHSTARRETPAVRLSPLRLCTTPNPAFPFHVASGRGVMVSSRRRQPRQQEGRDKVHEARARVKNMRGKGGMDAEIPPRHLGFSRQFESFSCPTECFTIKPSPGVAKYDRAAAGRSPC